MRRPAIDDLPTALQHPARVLLDAIHGFTNDECVSLAAGLAFFTMFSFAPLLVVFVHLASWVAGPGSAEAFLVGPAADLVGPAVAEQAQAIIEVIQSQSAGRGTSSGWWSFAFALFGATTVLSQLQTALNRVWGVAPQRNNSILSFAFKRLRSLAMVLAIGALLGISVLTSGIITGLTHMSPHLLGASLAAAAPVVDVLVSWLVISLAFGLLFTSVPDAQVSRRYAAVGGGATAAFFVVGKQAIGWYLGTAAVGSLYGAAGSLAALLTWVFYSALILLFGAELTESWDRMSGDSSPPSGGAERVSQDR